MLSRRFLRIKVIKSLYSHFQSDSDSIAVSEKNLSQSIDKGYDLYIQMLRLPVDIADYAAERIELARNKKLPTQEDLNPNTKFVDNGVIDRIRQSVNINSYLEKRSLGWQRNPELIRSLYQKMCEADYFKAYMLSDESSYRQDQKFVRDMFIETIQDDEQIESVVEEQSILWGDDIDFALILVVRTLDALRAKDKEVPLLPKFKNQDDVEFTIQLFRQTAMNYTRNMQYIERFAHNWDIERIAYLDNLIIATALTELIAFPSIPVKVTMDEYIEIAKFYSTPTSSLFINGVLDKAVDTLTQEGVIVKTGRGLL